MGYLKFLGANWAQVIDSHFPLIQVYFHTSLSAYPSVYWGHCLTVVHEDPFVHPIVESASQSAKTTYKNKPASLPNAIANNATTMKRIFFQIAKGIKTLLS